MRKLLLIISTILIFGCNTKPDEKSLVGVWSNCAEDGFYQEMQVTKKQYRYVSNAGKVYIWENYEFDGKHLKFEEKQMNDSVRISEANVVFIAEDQIKIEFLSTDETWIWNKVDETIDLSTSDKDIIEGVISRAKSSGCNATLFKFNEDVKFRF